jgi:hypothetical protein
MKYLHFLLGLILLVYSTLAYAQSEDYIYYLNTANERISQGECDKAESIYNIYKQMSGKKDAAFENMLRKCKEEEEELKGKPKDEIPKKDEVKLKADENQQYTLIKTVQPVEIEPKFHFGILTGIAKSDMKSDSWYFEDANETNSGLAIGFLFEYKISPYLSFQPELLYVPKGAIGNSYTSDKYVFTNTNEYIHNVLEKTTIRINYLELPLNLFVNIPLNKKSAYFFGGGYTLAYGLSGKATINPSKGDIVFNLTQEEKEVDLFNSEEPTLNRFDGSYNILGGLMIDYIFVRYGYEWGRNIAAIRRSDNYYFKNTCFTFQIGIKF